MAIYKGEDLLASSANSETLVRNPDWSNAVTLTIDQLWAGYTAPSDGMIIGYYQAPGGGVKVTYLTVNNVKVASSEFNLSNGYVTHGDVQTAVSKNDVIKFTQNKPTGATEIKFVPYGLYTAPDTLVPHNYSQDEQFTGNYWIDGKKIYRKVFKWTTSTSNATHFEVPYALNMINCGHIVREDYNDAAEATTHIYNKGTASCYFGVAWQSGSSGWSSSNGHWWIEYTKTTD